MNCETSRTGKRSRACAGCGQRFSTLNLGANLALATLKAVVGALAGSQALVAAALYSINDALSAVIVKISLSIGRKQPDEDHAYGYGKVEFVAIGAMALILVVSVLAVLVFSASRIAAGTSSPPHLIAAGVAALSVATNGLLARRGFCVARFLGSPSLYTSAEHNRADVISSVAVLVGVVGAAMGLHALDPLVAGFEAAHIAWLAGNLLANSLKGLTDAAPPLSTRQRIVSTCEQVEGVDRVVSMRSRVAGSHVWADVVLAIHGERSMEEAQDICEQVRHSVRNQAAGNVPMMVQVGFRPAEPIGVGQRPGGD